MIIKYDNFLTENVETKIFTLRWLNQLTLTNIDLVDNKFLINKIIHEYLDVDSHKAILFYSGNISMSKFTKFVKNIYLQEYKEYIIQILKKMNMGIIDIEVSDNSSYQNHVETKYPLNIVFKKTFFNGILNILEQDYQTNGEAAINDIRGYNNKGNRDDYAFIHDFIEKYLININRHKNNKLDGIIHGYVYGILRRYIDNNYNDLKKPEYKVTIEHLIQNGFKPIDFVDTTYLNEKERIIYEIEKTKPYNL